jgi:hypothetical protein
LTPSPNTSCFSITSPLGNVAADVAGRCPILALLGLNVTSDLSPQRVERQASLPVAGGLVDWVARSAANRRIDIVTIIARCCRDERVLISTPPRVPITWEAYASAAGPALGCPRFPTWGHTLRMQFRAVRGGGLFWASGPSDVFPAPHNNFCYRLCFRVDDVGLRRSSRR